MSRRRDRLHREMRSLADTLIAVGEHHSEIIEAHRRRAVDTIERYFLPRLAEEPFPLIVTLVGSTGAGKSTILNSIAGSPVSQVGVLRPTTREPVVWTGPVHARTLGWIGRVVADDHPLAAAVALVDTPDLDSDLPEHRLQALAIADASDALVMVTTASRYGDARPWEALTGLTPRPLAVVLNRVPARNSGARNFLATQLREMSYPDSPILTIGEQKTDRVGDKLPHQSVRRLLGLVKEWSVDPGELRKLSFERLADRTAADVRAVLESLRTTKSEHEMLMAIAANCHRDSATEVMAGLRAVPSRRRWHRLVPVDPARNAAVVLAGLAHAAGTSFVGATNQGLQLPSVMRSVAAGVLPRVSAMSPFESDDLAIEALFAGASASWAALFPVPSDGSTDSLSMGVEMLTGLEWPGV
ncbi:MAG: GTPase [Acidimicrobiia bacterium]